MLKYGYLLPTRQIVLASDDPATVTAKVESDIIGLARRAEAGVFSSVWVGDSVLAKPRIEPMATLAAVANATDAIGLGTAVYLPTLRNPIHVAHATASVDQISGGRLAIGIGVGIGPDVQSEYANLDIDFATRGERMEEVLQIVTALWDGDRVDFEGKFFDLKGASLGFEPVRKPPIYVPTARFDSSAGLPTSLRNRIIQHGDGWLPIGMQPHDYRKILADIRTFLSDVDRDPRAFDPAYYLDVVIDDEEAVAREEARSFYAEYYPAWDRLSDEELRLRGAFGSAESVAERLAEYVDAGVKTMVIRFTSRHQRRQLDRFGDVNRLL